MNIKITKRDLKDNFYYIVRGGYCEFQYLLRYAREIGYARGVYGWNWTAYSITASNGAEICVCTGYRDMVGKRLDGLAKFEEKAKEMFKNYQNYNEHIKGQKLLQESFADYIVANYDK